MTTSGRGPLPRIYTHGDCVLTRDILTGTIVREILYYSQSIVLCCMLHCLMATTTRGTLKRQMLHDCFSQVYLHTFPVVELKAGSDAMNSF